MRRSKPANFRWNLAVKINVNISRNIKSGLNNGVPISTNYWCRIAKWTYLLHLAYARSCQKVGQSSKHLKQQSFQCCKAEKVHVCHDNCHGVISYPGHAVLAIWTFRTQCQRHFVRNVGDVSHLMLFTHRTQVSTILP